MTSPGKCCDRTREPVLIHRDLKDEELVFRWRERQDQRAVDELIARYEGLVRWCAFDCMKAPPKRSGHHIGLANEFRDWFWGWVFATGKLDYFDSARASFRTFLSVIIRQGAWGDFWRERRTREMASDGIEDEADAHATDSTSSPSQEDLEAALTHLPATHRVCLLLQHTDWFTFLTEADLECVREQAGLATSQNAEVAIDGLFQQANEKGNIPAEAIAAALNITRSLVFVRRHRAKTALRAMLEEAQ